MVNTYLLLFFEFVKVGLFTFGGGYASLPFLYHMIDTYNWFNYEQLTQLIAISGITPGPIGLNMATFAGFKTLGFLGAIISSFALLLPMIVITSQVFRLYRKFSKSKCVESILFFLRPTSCALISGVGLKLFYNLILKNSFSLSNIDYCALSLFVILFIFTFFSKRDPIIYIVISALFGVLLIFVK